MGRFTRVSLIRRGEGRDQECDFPHRKYKLVLKGSRRGFTRPAGEVRKSVGETYTVPAPKSVQERRFLEGFDAKKQLLVVLDS